MQRFRDHNVSILAIVFSVLMWATRSHHLTTLTHLPDASWAIFFLIGFYFRNRSLLFIFLVQAGLIDYLSITQFGTSDYCVTLAYTFLLPAYSALWLAGRSYAARYQFKVGSLPLFSVVAVSGGMICELVSSGSFYFLGGRFVDTNLAEFASRLMQYFPADFESFALYLGLVVLIHVLIVSKQHTFTASQCDLPPVALPPISSKALGLRT